MFRGVLIGVAGAPLLLAGSFMLITARIRARHGRSVSRIDRWNSRPPA